MSEIITICSCTADIVLNEPKAANGTPAHRPCRVQLALDACLSAAQACRQSDNYAQVYNVVNLAELYCPLPLPITNKLGEERNLQLMTIFNEGSKNAPTKPYN